MSELISAIMELRYHVPQQTQTEMHFYELQKKLSAQLSEEERNLLDVLSDLTLDATGDTAENSFMQGLLTGIELICTLKKIA